MSYRIRVLGDPVLRQEATPVEDIDGRVVRMVEDMVPVMYEAEGIGLAAPQVGIQKRLFVYDIGEGPQTVVNPEIFDSDGEWVFEEEGTYDFFSRNHERLGAVGRIVVGSPGGPGEKLPGYGGRDGRAPMFAESAKLLSWLGTDRIIQDRIVRYPLDLLKRRFPIQENAF